MAPRIPMRVPNCPGPTVWRPRAASSGTPSHVLNGSGNKPYGHLIHDVTVLAALIAGITRFLSP